MLLYTVLCLYFFITNYGDAFPASTHEELYGRIANKHMLVDKDISTVINGQKPVLYEEYLARDCRSAYIRGRKRSGLYIIRPKFSPLLIVYCDMEYDGGGWTVLHRNYPKQKTAWSRTWDEYKKGFGNLMTSHWLGNEYIHLLTRQNPFSVRIVLMDSSGNSKHVDYHSFQVDDESTGYALRLGNYTGDAPDALTTMGESGIHDNMRFSTQDNDNDRRAGTNCALDHAGGWWYDNCYSALLTSDNNIYWKGLCTEANPCQLASIMIRPGKQNCNIPSRY